MAASTDFRKEDESPKRHTDSRTIPEQNLELMLSQEDGGMAKCISAESWGVNAGVDEDGHSRVAANFLYNPYNGRIKYFGNLDNRPREWDEMYRDGHYPEGTFVLSHQNGGPLQIIEVRNVLGISEESKRNISKSAGLYNKYREEKDKK